MFTIVDQQHDVMQRAATPIKITNEALNRDVW